MTNTLNIKTAALAAYTKFFDALPNTDIDADFMLNHLDTPARLTASDAANSDDDSYAMIFQLTMTYDDCTTDILIINPDAPTYFISIDANDYQPMI